MNLFLQITAAMLVGVFYYMIAVLMTVYDGVLSVILQPIVGGIVTAVVLGFIGIAGLPIRLWPSLNLWWRRKWWLALVLGLIAFAMMALSCVPFFQVRVMHPELETEVSVFHPGLGWGGWLLMLFAVLHFYPPMFGRKDDRAR